MLGSVATGAFIKEANRDRAEDRPADSFWGDKVEQKRKAPARAPPGRQPTEKTFTDRSGHLWRYYDDGVGSPIVIIDATTSA